MAVAYPNTACQGFPHDPLNNMEPPLAAAVYHASCYGRKDIDWFALRVRPRYEKLTATMLRNKGYENLLPLYKRRRKSGGRYREVLLPIFPGYLFCQFNPGTRLPILTTPGVIHVVGCGRTPIPIDEQEMESIRRLDRSRLPAEPWPYLEAGQRVYIADGPLNGAAGILLALKDRHRIVLSVTLLQRAVAVEIERDWVRPVR